MITFRHLLPLVCPHRWPRASAIQSSRNFWSKKSTNNTGDETKNKNKNKPQLPAIRNPFDSAQDKTKEAYLDMITIFEDRSVHRRNHVEFIYAALKSMTEFGVERDIEVYKALINVMPKGKFIPTNTFQAEFMHYPKQQQCIIDLLEQMEDLGVMPDYEMEAMLLNVFGRRGHPVRKYWRMMYWMPKFKNASPWPLPNPVPNEALELAKMAIERMCTVDLLSQVDILDTKDVKDAVDQTWIVSGMSTEQSQLLREHNKSKAVYIEGPFLIWLRNKSINYFTLRADPDKELLKTFNVYQDPDDVSKLEVPFFGKPIVESRIAKKPSVHQQNDGTIFAICATGTSTKDSLLSWVRLLEANGNPVLGEIPILFKFRTVVDSNIVPVAGVPTKTHKIS
ncbi:evolutionarily conserved signaling intermediate in Toll pathway, mitochondrial [Episyrphus balteatus]|uniref:evolutionarily conserved signaling intermediate in Toll pathway, mitochondrial n=1 Tax=Episyrphus balteatus TaxID=286459 RepID=UPI002485578A|nr:evolutionarily conserved signaling intermediate in Toll pathway, mitochondrial [Episyrphus balteatus]